MSIAAPPSDLVDVVSQVPQLNAYWFLGVAGAVTVAGFFLDGNGVRTGASFTASVNVAGGGNNPKGFVDIAGSIPADAVGFSGSTSAALWIDISLNSTHTFDSDFKTNFANYPQVQASTLITLGRVA